MRRFGIRFALPFLVFAAALLAGTTARAEGDPHKAKHVIVIMQENHSFDNYFGALAYAPGSPYHNPRREDGDDHNNEDLHGRFRIWAMPIGCGEGAARIRCPACMAIKRS